MYISKTTGLIKIIAFSNCEHMLTNRLPTIPTLQGFLEDAGFSLGPAVVITDIIFRKEHWLDKEGPFREEWRNTDRY